MSVDDAVLPGIAKRITRHPPSRKYLPPEDGDEARVDVIKGRFEWLVGWPIKRNSVKLVVEHCLDMRVHVPHAALFLGSFCSSVRSPSFSMSRSYLCSGIM